jgi:hypothetical protein
MKLTIVHTLSNNIIDEYIIDITESINNIIKRIENKLNYEYKYSNRVFKFYYNDIDFIIYKYTKKNLDYLLKDLNIEEKDNIIFKILIKNLDYYIDTKKYMIDLLKTNECLDTLYYIAYKNYSKLCIYISCIINECLNNYYIIQKISNKILILFLIDNNIFYNTGCRIDNILQFASDEIKDDKEIILAAINRYDGNSIKYASETLRNNKELVEYAVNKSGFAFRYASDELQKDKTLALKAVSKAGYLFKCLSDDYKRDKEIILVAVQNYEHALKYVPVDCIDIEIVLTAVKYHESALKYVPNDYKEIN